MRLLLLESIKAERLFVSNPEGVQIQLKYEHNYQKEDYSLLLCSYMYLFCTLQFLFMSSPRRSNREFLLQLLYAHTYVSWLDESILVSTYFSGKNAISFDQTYLDAMKEVILKNEKELIAIINVISPRFDASTLPIMHILILMISIAEMMYFTWENIPESVSINEGIELAKRFSDQQGKSFINGALSTFSKDKKIILSQLMPHTFTIFNS